MLPDSPRNWEIPIPRHLEEKVERNWLTETLFEEKNSAELPYLFFSSTKTNQTLFFNFLAEVNANFFENVSPSPMLSWWPVFGNSAHPIATSHKRTWKVGVPFWNTVGYQGDHRNPKGQCTPPMPRLPPLKYQGLISAGLIQGQEGFSIICYLATVGCWLLVVGCWFVDCWLLLLLVVVVLVVVFCCCQVASGRCSKTTRNLLRHLLVHPNLPRHKHTWTQVEGSYLARAAYVLRRKTKHHVVKFQISLRSLKEKKTCETTSGEDI